MLFIPRISERFFLQFVLSSSLISCSAPFIQLCMFSTKSVFSSLLLVNILIPTLLNSLSGLPCNSPSLDANTVELGTFGGVLLSWNLCALCYCAEVYVSAVIPLLSLFFYQLYSFSQSISSVQIGLGSGRIVCGPENSSSVISSY